MKVLREKLANLKDGFYRPALMNGNLLFLPSEAESSHGTNNIPESDVETAKEFLVSLLILNLEITEMFCF